MEKSFETFEKSNKRKFENSENLKIEKRKMD